MAAEDERRIYAVLRTTPQLLDVYRRSDLNALDAFTQHLLRAAGGVPAFVAEQCRVVSAPSLDFMPEIAGWKRPDDLLPRRLVIAYRCTTEAAAEAFLAFVEANRGRTLDDQGNAVLDAGADPGGFGADHWCPGTAGLASFGSRAQVQRSIGTTALAARGLSGIGVNVVLIDQGLNETLLVPPSSFGGRLGSPINPPVTHDAHGMMVARNVLDIAPGALLYDVPIIPPRIVRIPAFASTAHAAYEMLIVVIVLLRLIPRWSGPWILVNAWAILDRASDTPPFGSYTENKAAGGHPLIKLVASMATEFHIDVVFAAGNTGEFCPDRRAGPRDRGPGHSIWGANALPEVITVGAARADDTWLGYSSQGPGPGANGLASLKPDLCAPSQFHETTDPSTINSGTSAACALTAGLLAALRSNPVWNQTAVSPAIAKQALLAGARLTHGPAWNNRFGHGMLNAALTMARLP